jgi:hypothetical protein
VTVAVVKAILLFFVGKLPLAVNQMNFFEATGAEKLFSIIDTDSDAKISLTEAKEYFRKIRPTNVNIDEEFHKLDISNHGFLAVDEIDGR